MIAACTAGWPYENGCYRHTPVTERGCDDCTTDNRLRTERQAIQVEVDKDGWTDENMKRHACYRWKSWEQLVKQAKELANVPPNDFDKWNIKHREEQAERAKAECKGRA